jgi:hypothetical protein
MAEAPLRVFLSHTSELRRLPAGGSYVAAAETAIAQTGAAVRDMEYFAAEDRTAAEVCRAVLGEVDVYVLVAGFRYGTPVPGRPEVSYTELEFEVAGELGLPRLAFLLDRDEVIGTAGLLQDHEYGARQEVFRERVLGSGLVARSVRSPDHLQAELLHALDRHRERSRPPDSGIWNIPGRTADLTGRAGLLAQLGADFRAGRPAQVLHGIPGAGKSTIAVEYAQRHRDDNDIGWWIAGEDTDAVPNALAELAVALRLADVTDPIQVALGRLYGVLRKRGRWLIVVDNAAGDPDTLRGLLPQGPGHVLITCRNPDWPGAGAVPVGDLDRADSVGLLRSRRPDLDVRDAGRIAAELGDLAQAVEQAAGMLAETELDPAGYLRELTGRAEAVLGWDVEGDITAGAAAAFGVAFDRLEAEDPAAMQLLTLLAWLAQVAVPQWLFAGRPELLPAPLAAAAGDPLSFPRRIARLRRQGLVAAGRAAPGAPATLELHRVPATLLRARSAAGEWTARAVRVLRVALPPVSIAPASRSAWQLLLPHVLVATQRLIDHDGDISPDWSWLIVQVGRYELAVQQGFVAEFATVSTRPGEVIGGTLTAAERAMIQLMGPQDRARYLLQKRSDEKTEMAVLLSQLQGLRHQAAMSVINNIR